MQETWVWFLGREDPLVKGMAIHSSVLAWRIPWTEEPGGLQPGGLQRVGLDWATTTTTRASWCAQGKDRRGHGRRGGWGLGQRRQLPESLEWGEDPLSIWWVRAGLPGSLGKHTWLSAGGGNHLPFLLALGSWMNKSVPVKQVFTVWKQHEANPMALLSFLLL